MHNQQAAIERAQLIAEHDALVVWQKTFNKKQAELIAWMASIENRLKQHDGSICDVIEGCLKIVDTETLLSDRMDIIGERVDIVNKRIRILENAK